MSRQQNLEAQVRAALPIEFLQIINESHMHRGPANAETHFKLVIVSPVFEGQRSVRRHQQVYAALGEEFRTGLHALALHTYTPQEWADSGEAPASPACQHRRPE